MILLQPNVTDQSVSVFVRTEHAGYRVFLTNESTKEVTIFDIDIGDPDFDYSEGLLTFNLQATPNKDIWYTMIVRFFDNHIMNYSMCYCGDSLTQQYQRVDPLYKQPTKPLPTYNMPSNG